MATSVKEPVSLGGLGKKDWSAPDSARVGEVVSINFGTDWPDYMGRFKTFANIEVKSSETRETVLSKSSYKKEWRWWDWKVSEGAHITFTMPPTSIDVNVEVIAKKKPNWPIGDLVKAGELSGTWHVEAKGGNGGNGDGGNSDEKEIIAMLQKKYYGVEAWKWGIGGAAGLIILQKI